MPRCKEPMGAGFNVIREKVFKMLLDSAKVKEVSAEEASEKTKAKKSKKKEKK